MITETEWLTYAEQNQEALEHLIASWHPVTAKPYGDMSITAPNAEVACEVIREQLRVKDTRDPIVRFREALKNDQWELVNIILNETWFGVPESRDCWSLKGFKEAIVLMESLPNED